MWREVIEVDFWRVGDWGWLFVVGGMREGLLPIMRRVCNVFGILGCKVEILQLTLNV